MVKPLAVLALLPAIAAADPIIEYAKPPPDADVLWLQPPPPPPPEEAKPPAHNKLGFRIGFGRLHAFDRRLSTTSLGLEIEHPVFEHVRVFADYEWMWFGDRTPMSPATEGQPGTGHRTSIGMRAELIGGTIQQHVHFYIDGEVGGGLGVLSDDVSGVQVLPHAFAGLRAGYTFLWGNENRHSSRTFEAELIARALRMPDGATGAMFGIGMLWGD